jgi:hypothetical protein
MSMLSSPQLPADIEAARPARRSRGPRAQTMALLAVALLLAATLATFGPDRVASALSATFQAYVQAQARMLSAASNLSADGRSEFAVLLRNDASVPAFRQALLALDDVRFERESDLGGWVVVTAMPGNRSGLEALMAMPQTRLVVPNRGLWICH